MVVLKVPAEFIAVFIAGKFHGIGIPVGSNAKLAIFNGEAEFRILEGQVALNIQRGVRSGNDIAVLVSQAGINNVFTENRAQFRKICNHPGIARSQTHRNRELPVNTIPCRTERADIDTAFYRFSRIVRTPQICCILKIVGQQDRRIAAAHLIIGLLCLQEIVNESAVELRPCVIYLPEQNPLRAPGRINSVIMFAAAKLFGLIFGIVCKGCVDSVNKLLRVSASKKCSSGPHSEAK